PGIQAPRCRREVAASPGSASGTRVARSATFAGDRRTSSGTACGSVDLPGERRISRDQSGSRLVLAEMNSQIAVSGRPHLTPLPASVPGPKATLQSRVLANVAGLYVTLRKIPEGPGMATSPGAKLNWKPAPVTGFTG